MDLQLPQRIAEGSKWLQQLVLGAPAPAAALASPTTTGRGSETDLEKGLHELEVERIPTTARRRSNPSISSAQNEKQEGEPQPPPPPKRPPLTLQTLPPEVQMLIIKHLQFGDIERLRRTCWHYHEFADRKTLRTLFGEATLRGMQERHCGECLTYDKDGQGLLQASRMRKNYPLNAKCVKCALSTRDDRLGVGRKVVMGNGEGVWVCRWCGWLVTTPAAHSNAQFHKACWIRYNDSLLFFFLLGLLQFSLGIVAAALSWRYFRGEDLVFYPTVVSFILLWVTFFMLLCRGSKTRTYHWTLLLELAILGLWVPPVMQVARIWMRTSLAGELATSTTATLVMFGFNMVFRLVNVVGNVVLVSNYKRTSHHLPEHMVPLWRRYFTNPLMDWLIFWTYPQSVEQKFPPHWN